MTEVYAINPLAHMEGVRSLLTELTENIERGKIKLGESVVIRMCTSGLKSITIGDIKIDQSATVKVFSTEEGVKTSVVTDENAIIDNVVKIIKENNDVSISFEPSYMVIEVPAIRTNNTASESYANRLLKGKEKENDVTTVCFPTKKKLVRFLRSIGANPYGKREGTDPTITNEWKGEEKILGDGSVDSTMCFSSVYKFYEMTVKDAISFLSAHSSLNPEEPVFIRESPTRVSKIYVIKNEPCRVDIIPSSDFYTQPMTKQRLLYVYDCINYSMQKNLSKILLIKSKYNPKNQPNTEFNYSYALTTFGLRITPENASFSIPIFDTGLWTPFVEAKTIKEKIMTVVDLFNLYGLMMTIDDYIGSTEDYVEDRSSFILPQHAHQESKPSIGNIITMPVPKSTTRSQSRSKQYKEQRGQSSDPTKRTRSEKEHNGRGRVRYGGRGFGRGRGSQENNTNENPNQNVEKRRGRGRGNNRDDQGQYLRGASRGKAIQRGRDNY
jgi:hypothetical protein